MVLLAFILCGLAAGLACGGSLRAMAQHNIALLWLPVAAYLCKAAGPYAARLFPAFASYAPLAVCLLHYGLLFIFVAANPAPRCLEFCVRRRGRDEFCRYCAERRRNACLRARAGVGRQAPAWPRSSLLVRSLPTRLSQTARVLFFWAMFWRWSRSGACWALPASGTWCWEWARQCFALRCCVPQNIRCDRCLYARRPCRQTKRCRKRGRCSGYKRPVPFAAVSPSWDRRSLRPNTRFVGCTGTKRRLFSTRGFIYEQLYNAAK